MSFATLAGKVLVAGFTGTRVPAPLAEMAARGRLAGTIVFSRNFAATTAERGTPEAFATAVRLCGELATMPSDAPLLLCIDEEGGRVRRLGAPVPQLPPARRFGERDDPALTERAGHALGAALRAVGVNVDFAPILDVDTNPDNPIIGDRAFGREPAQVIRHALAFASGLHRAGVLSCGKHFPGHGDTDLDSHLALPRIPHERARLDRVELPPFAAAKGTIPLIMTAHVVFSAIDPELPATLSRAVIQGVLRDELGYDGVIVSDDLEMKAVAAHYGVAESAVRAIEAGCDLLLVCESLDELGRAHGALTERAASDARFADRLAEAAARVDALRGRLPTFAPRSVDEIRAEIASGPGAAVLAELASATP